MNNNILRKKDTGEAVAAGGSSGQFGSHQREAAEPPSADLESGQKIKTLLEVVGSENPHIPDTTAISYDIDLGGLADILDAEVHDEIYSLDHGEDGWSLQYMGPGDRSSAQPITDEQVLNLVDLNEDLREEVEMYGELPLETRNGCEQLRTAVPNQTDREELVRSHVAAALWSSVGDDGEPLDSEYDIDDLSSELESKLQGDLAAFVKGNGELVSEYLNHSSFAGKTDVAFAQLGHDFWLNRNGHGAGFWDRGLGDLGDKLSDASKSFGEVDLFLGDDNKIFGV